MKIQVLAFLTMALRPQLHWRNLHRQRYCHSKMMAFPVKVLGYLL